jgi:hypothetical protein
MVPQWVLLLKGQGDLTPAGFMLYCLLLAHVNTSRGDGRTWVTQESIGKMLDMHPNSVGRLINGELARLGLVDVSTHRYGDNNTRKRNVYTVHEVPEKSFTGFRSLAAWHAANKSEEGEPPTYLAENMQVNPKDGGSDMNHTPDSTVIVGPDSTCGLSPEATLMVDKLDEAKTRLLPPPPSSVGFRSDDEDEETKEAPAGQDDDYIEITSEDLLMARRLLGAVPWPSKFSMGVKVKERMLDRLSVMAAKGWTEEMIRDLISSRIPDWSRARQPAVLVASILEDSPLGVSEAFTGPVEAQEDAEVVQADAEAKRLEIQYAQQKLVIAECIECDELGYVMPHGTGSIQWHGHGKMSLSSEMRKAQAAAARLREERATGESPWDTAS